jgi:c-di-GMP-binding flagellar brake protein YcgR
MASEEGEKTAGQGAAGGLTTWPRNRRLETRCGVDTSAVIRLIKTRSQLAGQILDLSMGGCRIHTVERFPLGIYTRVEVEFHLRGLPLLLGGVVQAIHERKEVGIRFLDVSPRKRDDLKELIAEIEECRNSGIGNVADAG